MESWRHLVRRKGVAVSRFWHRFLMCGQVAATDDCVPGSGLGLRLTSRFTLGFAPFCHDRRSLMQQVMPVASPPAYENRRNYSVWEEILNATHESKAVERQKCRHPAVTISHGLPCYKPRHCPAFFCSPLGVANKTQNASRSFGSDLRRQN